MSLRLLLIFGLLVQQLVLRPCAVAADDANTSCCAGEDDGGCCCLGGDDSAGCGCACAPDATPVPPPQPNAFPNGLGNWLALAAPSLGVKMGSQAGFEACGVTSTQLNAMSAQRRRALLCCWII